MANAFIRIRADSTKLAGDLDSARNRFIDWITGIRAKLLTIVGAAASVAIAIKSIFVAAEFEQITIAFETMLGSVQETKELLADLVKFAAETPFQLPGILSAARGLVTFGERGDELLETLKILGNAAAGAGSNFSELALIFNQIRGVGKLLTQDFRQLASRGVISLADIAKHFNISQAAAQGMMTAGQISFKAVRDILKGLQGEGGRFQDLMEKMSLSFSGVFSTLKDNIGKVVRILGDQFLPAAKKFVDIVLFIVKAVGNWMEAHKTLTGITLKLVIALGLTGAAILTLIAISISWVAKAVAVGVAMKALNFVLALFNIQALTATRVWIILLSLLGPKGWVILAGAVAATTATFIALHFAMRDTSVTMDKLEGDLKEGGEGLDKLSDKAGSAKDALKAFETTAEGVVESLKEMAAIGPKAFEGAGRLGQLIRSITQGQLKGFKPAQFLKGAFKSPTTGEFEPQKAFGFLTEQMKTLRGLDVQRTFDEFVLGLAAMKEGAFLTAEEVAKLTIAMREQLNIDRPADAIDKQIQRALKELLLLKGLTTEIDETIREAALAGASLEKREKLRGLLKGIEKQEQLKGPGIGLGGIVGDFLSGIAKPISSAVGKFRDTAKVLSEKQPQDVLQGRFGFREFGKRLQDQLLKRDDPQKKILEVNKQQKITLDKMLTGIGDLARKLPAAFTLGPP